MAPLHEHPAATLASRSADVRRIATDELGFDLVGIAAAEQLVDDDRRYRQFLAAGRHGSMDWLARNLERRGDVRELLPSARSVVVVARNYFTPHAHHPDTAKISRYAWGRDYHKILPKRLELLEQRIRQLVPDAKSRHYVDTGPVLEKAWAVRAGLGWLGKHTNVITRSHGSWVFLGVLITSAELIPDNPIGDFCGTCTLCIDACPTDAIVAPYQLDATRCLSYVTIEQKPKDEIPPDFADRMEGWAFGCDICQDVCPWNSFEQPTDEADFEPRAGVLELTARRLAGMTDEEFLERFAGSPVMRAKAAGMRRNARALLRSQDSDDTDGE